jgi:hypothetical protein
MDNGPIQAGTPTREDDPRQAARPPEGLRMYAYINRKSRLLGCRMSSSTPNMAPASHSSSSSPDQAAGPRAAYDIFFALWKDADLDIPVLK